MHYMFLLIISEIKRFVFNSEGQDQKDYTGS